MLYKIGKILILFLLPLISFAQLSDPNQRRFDFSHIQKFIPNLPIIIPGGSFSPFSTSLGTHSATQSIPFTGSNLTANVTGTVGSVMEISSDGISFGTTEGFVESGGSISATLYARISSTAPAGPYSGNITLSSTTATVSIPYSATIAVNIDTLNVQIWDSAGSGGPIGKFINSQWNNYSPWAMSTASLTSASLIWTNGTNSGIQLVTSNVNDYTNNGATWGSTNTTGYPTGVYYIGMYNTVNSTLKFINVPSGTYRIEIISATPNGTGPQNATWAVGATSGSVNSFGNLSNVVVLDNLSPTTGSLTINVTITNTFSVINAIRLIKKT